MASTAIIGLPGGGKSYYAVERLVQFLREDPRNVVTNIPLQLDLLAEYMAKTNNDFTVLDRVTLLDPLDFEKAKHFFLERGGGLRIDKFPDSFAEFSDGESIDAAKIRERFGPGVVYFLDEVHQFLNARNWKDVGSSVLKYLSMHRHLGDDIFWITQAPGNVDKQWRSLTQSYFSCRNFKYERFRGFSKGSGMEVRETLNIPSPHASEVAQSVQNRKLDPKIAALYNTSVMQGTADTGKKPRGINYQWLIVAVFVVLMGGGWAVWKGSGWAMSRVGKNFGWGTTPEKPKIFADTVAAPAATLPLQSSENEEVEVKIPPRPAFVLRQDGRPPAGYIPAVLNKKIMVKADSNEADRLGVIPAKPGDLTVQGYASWFGAPAVCLDGRLYCVTQFLPDGCRLISVNPPAGRDQLGNVFYYTEGVRSTKSGVSGSEVSAVTGEALGASTGPGADRSDLPMIPSVPK